MSGFNPALIVNPRLSVWSQEARSQLLSLVDKLCDKKWPAYLEDNSVLRLSDLKIPPNHRFSQYNDERFGVYGQEPMGDLNLFSSLQAAVYKELMAQRLDLQDLNKISMDFKWRPQDLEADIIKYVDLERRLRLFRSPTQIVHADTKSNKIGLGFQVKVWNQFKAFLLPYIEEQPQENDEVM
jgi:hypothetical protein